MSFSDPVANMLAIINNAIMRGYKEARFPLSKLKLDICDKLVKEKRLQECQVKDREILIKIPYVGKNCKIKSVKKISTVSRHVYLKANKVLNYCRGKGTFIISTSRGLLNQYEASKENQGGKVLLFVGK